MENQESYKTIASVSNGYYEEKKSRFIGTLLPVFSEEEAGEKLSEIRSRYYDAHHCCYAYILHESPEKVKSSDDGEPAKTAGLPILAVLRGAGLTNVLCAVTRYFGGTLLGTGGLTRAYQAAARDCLNEAKIVSRETAIALTVKADYTKSEKLRRYFLDQDIPIVEAIYEAFVNYRIVFHREQEESILQKITDLTQNTAIMEDRTEVFASFADGSVEIHTK